MDLRQLEYFCAIVEAGSLSAAARRIPVAQPTLTVAMRNLEREVRTPLLIRAAPGVTPTEAGRYLHEEARRILREVANATTHLHEMARGAIGDINLSAGQVYSWGHLATVLNAVTVAAPDIHVRLSDPPPLEILRRVGVGDDDLGIVTTSDPGRLAELYGDRLEFRPLCELPIVAVLPPAFSDAPDPIGLDELRDQPWIVPATPPSFPGMASLMERMWSSRGWTPRVIRKVSASETSLPMIAGGLGVALMPNQIGSLAGRSVELRRTVETVPALIAVAVWQRERAMTPATRTFLRVLTEVHRDDVARVPQVRT
ncbi:LysR family transcriptional regulator [Nakamurella deserti]|uniref:LysR family transcriptional regulator n=1 Tax=Nakamurella deserti TaxID=2164074 RepID=UPI0014794095|nr:LysR family transcriptional regulator [Nakamurella deserti]